MKFLSSPAFANEFGAHYGWAPVRSDVNTAKGDPQVQRVNRYVLSGWDGLPTGPKMAQLTMSTVRRSRRRRPGSPSVQESTRQGAEGRNRHPQELIRGRASASEGEDVSRKRQRPAWDELTLSPDEYRRASTRYRRRRSSTAYLFILPYFIPFLAFLVVPVFWSIWLSFNKGGLLDEARTSSACRTGARSATTPSSRARSRTPRSTWSRRSSSSSRSRCSWRCSSTATARAATSSSSRSTSRCSRPPCSSA